MIDVAWSKNSRLISLPRGLNLRPQLKGSIEGMIPSRGLAALIWGVVALIAIQLVPTTARAHAGHAHVSGAQVSGAYVPGSSSAVTHDRASDHAISPRTSVANPEVATAAPDNDGSTAPAAPCNCGYCATGCPCCVPMILAEPGAGWPSPSNATDIIAQASSTRPGVDPEAPAKPPKSCT